MTSGGREIDVLEALGEGVTELLEAIEAASASSAYIDGQRAFFEAVAPAVDEAGPDERPQAVLERVASRLGVEVEDHAIVDPPLDEHEAGVLAAWGICIGYVEGFPAGARAVISEVDATAGMEGHFGED